MRYLKTKTILPSKKSTKKEMWKSTVKCRTESSVKKRYVEEYGQINRQYQVSTCDIQKQKQSYLQRNLQKKEMKVP